MPKTLIASLFAALFMMTTHAAAHSSNEAYVLLDVGDDSLGGLIELRLTDVNALLDFDADGDGTPTQAEFDAAQAQLYTFIAGQVGFDIDGQSVPITIDNHEFFETEQGVFTGLTFSTDWTTPMPETITVHFTGETQEGGAIERALILVRNNARTGLVGNLALPSLIFEPGTRTQELSLAGQSAFSRFWLFVTSGLKHIFEGHDHIAFIIALLLPSVLIRKSFGNATPVDSLRQGLWSMLKVVTVFTIAHSITLSLAALNIVSYWGELVEFMIALSIFVVAFQNIFGKTANWVYAIVFGLGLLHGLGFASVLAPYGAYQSELWLTLLGFNLGVEIGQALIVLVLFPILFALRRWALYGWVVNGGGSALLGLVALYWMWNRILNVMATMG